MIESAAMKLAELVDGVSGATVRGDPSTEIRGLAYHTRDVADGTLFFCVPGLKFDGHEFAGRVVEAGAGAKVAAGARVAVYPLLWCGRCPSCRRHRRRRI